MNKIIRVLATVALAAGLTGAGVLAQTPPSNTWLTGPVEAVSAESITLQGISLSVAPDASFYTVLGDGTIESVALEQVAPGDPFQARMVILDDVPTVVGGFVGHSFFWHGVVTAVNADDEHNLVSIELDGLVTVAAGQAAVVGKPPGEEGNMDLSSLESYAAEAGDSELVQVGSTVGVAGLVNNEVFAATLINVAAVDFRLVGRVRQVALNDDGHVVGFALGKNGATYGVRLSPYTRVIKRHKPVSPDVIRAGQRVRVTGKVLADETVLAYEVKILH